MDATCLVQRQRVGGLMPAPPRQCGSWDHTSCGHIAWAQTSLPPLMFSQHKLLCRMGAAPSEVASCCLSLLVPTGEGPRSPYDIPWQKHVRTLARIRATSTAADALVGRAVLHVFPGWTGTQHPLVTLDTSFWADHKRWWWRSAEYYEGRESDSSSQTGSVCSTPRRLHSLEQDFECNARWIPSWPSTEHVHTRGLGISRDIGPATRHSC